MKFPKLSDKTMRKLGRAGLKLKKYAPEILIGAGLVFNGGAIVLACQATKKLPEIQESKKEALNAIEEVKEYAAKGEVEYSEEDEKHDRTVVCIQTGWSYIKAYAPAVGMAVSGAILILCGTGKLKKRNAALSLAYAEACRNRDKLAERLKAYRSRVANEVGEEKENDLYNDVHEETITVVDKETGEVKTETVKVGLVPHYSEYARIFDETNELWVNDAEQNLMLIKNAQCLANNALRRKGYLWLNEVYELLGFPASGAGQVVGWIYDESDPEKDNFVDFGLYDINNPRKAEFLNGNEKNVILDFNVEGYIFDDILAREDAGTGNIEQDKLDNFPYYKGMN